MKIDEILKEIAPDILKKLEELRVRLKAEEVGYEAFKKEMLTNPEVKKEYNRLEKEDLK